MLFPSRREASLTHPEVVMGRMGRRQALSVRAFTIIIVLVLCLSWPSEISPYAVLAHEAIIDSVWDANLRPLLLKRFPGATAGGRKVRELALSRDPSSRCGTIQSHPMGGFCRLWQGLIPAWSVRRLRRRRRQSGIRNVREVEELRHVRLSCVAGG